MRGNNLNVFFNLIFSLILFPRNLRPLIIILFSIAIIIVSFVKKNRFNWKFFVVNSLVYVLIILTIFYTQNFKEASLKIEIMLSLFLFPLLFSLLPKEKYELIYKNKLNYFHVYISSIILFNVLVFVVLLIRNHNFLYIIKHFGYFVNTSLGRYNIHPIYLSIHIGLGIIFCFFSLQKNKNIYKFLFLSLLFFFLIILSKKGPIISLIMISIYLFSIILSKRYKKRAFILLLLSIISMFSYTKVRESFKELFKIEELTNDSVSSTNIRLAIYESSVEPIKKSFIFGYGIGDYNIVLSESYNNQVLVEGNYNSHNQYISFLLIGGIVLLSVFLLIQIYNIKLAVKKSDYLFITVSLFYLLNMLTESILEREDGVVFFSFFISFLAYKHYIRNEE